MQLFGLQSGLSGIAGRTAVGSPQQGTRGPAFTNAPGSIVARTTSGFQFRPGQTLFCQVAGRGMDGSFSLKFGNTQLIARSQVPLNVGESIHVAVQGQKDGLLHLQVVKSAFTPMSSQDVNQTLTGLKLPLTESNAALAKSMIEHNIPLTKENLTALKTAMAQLPESSGGVTAPKVGATWFLQSSSLPATPQNITTLANFISVHPQLGQQMLNLQAECRKLSTSGVTSEKAAEILEQVPGILGEMVMEPANAQKKTSRASRRLFDLAKQAGIETHLELNGGAEADWEMAELMQQLKNMLAGEPQAGALLESLAGFEENLRALKLINTAKPDPGLAFYYMQVPLRPETGEFAEIWIRYRQHDDGVKEIDPQASRLEFYISTEYLGELACTLDVSGRVVNFDMAAECEEIRIFAERYLPVLAERLEEAGWVSGEFSASLRRSEARSLVEYQDFDTLESINVQA